MRALLFFLASLASVVAGSAQAQSWTPGGTLNFLQGNAYNLSMVMPAVGDLDSATLTVSYAPDVFEAPALASFSSGFYTFVAGDVGPPGPSLVQAGYDDVVMTMLIGGTGVNVPAGGLLFTLSLAVKPGATLGPTTVLNEFRYSTASGTLELAFDLPIAANIVAVPEPHTWVMLGAGLLLLGAARTVSRSHALVRRPA